MDRPRAIPGCEIQCEDRGPDLPVDLNARLEGRWSWAPWRGEARARSRSKFNWEPRLGQAQRLDSGHKGATNAANHLEQVRKLLGEARGLR